MSLASAHALFWYLRNSFFFELGLEKNKNVRVFRYENLATNPIPEFSSMFTFCECPFKSDYTNEVFSSSIRKNPIPRIDSKIRKLCDDLYGKFISLADKSNQG